MKRIMILAIAVLGVCMFASCEKSDDITPDQPLVDALQAKYPDVTRAEWEKKKTFFVAEFWLESKEMDAWFNQSAQWLMTDIEWTRAALPEAVTTALAAGKYADWRVDDVDKLEYASGTVKYVIEVEQGKKEFDLYFSETGELLAEEDVTNKDDTHWPE